MLDSWALIECDFQEHYNLDLDNGLLRRRSGRWLRTRILGLLSMESRLRSVTFPPEERR